MDFLSNQGQLKSDHDARLSSHDAEHDRKPSKSDILHSAKVVADAAQARVRREPDKYDKAQLAGATADLLNAAAEYGNLDDTKGIGKYVDKAEDYLRHYHASHSTK